MANLYRLFSSALLVMLMVSSSYTSRAQFGHSSNRHRKSIFNDSRAVNGIGIKLGSFSPRKEHGENFKNAAGVEIYFAADHWDGWLTQKAGLTYTQFTPKFDSVPDYKSGVAVPYAKKLDKMPMYGLFIDESFRFFYTHNISVHGGPGILIGKTKYSYVNYSSGAQVGEYSLENFVVGFRNHLSVDYTIQPKCRAYFEVMNTMSTTLDREVKCTFNTYSIGLIYYFVDVDE